LGITAIKLEGIDIDAGTPALNDTDLALATTMLERGLKEAMDGVSIIRRHKVAASTQRGRASSRRGR
jgi:hypothetical protein